VEDPGGQSLPVDSILPLAKIVGIGGVVLDLGVKLSPCREEGFRLGLDRKSWSYRQTADSLSRFAPPQRVVKNIAIGFR
jgi:hypothetical protein